jgi:hypothetical protein
MKVSVVFLLLLLGVPCMAQEPSSSVSQKKQLSTPNRSFDADYKQLKSLYNDETISSNFDKSQIDLANFLSSPILGEGSPSWAISYKTTVDAMLDANWLKAEENLAEARIAKASPPAGGNCRASAANLPDLLLLSAILNKAMGHEKRL